MPDHPQTRPQVLQYYQQKLEAAEKEVKDSAGQWSAVGIVRGLLLLASIVLGVMALLDAFELRSLAGPGAGVVFVAFVLVALYHEGLQTKMRQGKMLITMHRESIARMNRQWKDIKAPAIEIPDLVLGNFERPRSVGRKLGPETAGHHSDSVGNRDVEELDHRRGSSRGSSTATSSGG